MRHFTIILPFQAAEATIDETLDSLQAQTFHDWEAICVNDRSPDASAEIVARYAEDDPRIRLVTSPGIGPSDARNCAVELANSEILAFCDADDIWAPDKLAELAQVFEESSASGVYGQIAFFHEQCGDCRTKTTVPIDDLTIAGLLAENPVCTMSNFTVRRSAFLSVRGFNPKVIHNEDLDLLIRLIGQGHRISGINTLQVWYRTTPTGLSADLSAMRRGRDGAIRSAARYGVSPSPASEAVYLRYLARRSLRLDTDPKVAQRYALEGLRTDATAFLFPLRRGVATAVAVCLARLMTPRLRRALFTR